MKRSDWGSRQGVEGNIQQKQPEGLNIIELILILQY